MAGVVDQLIDQVVFAQLNTYEQTLKSCAEVTEKFAGETYKLVESFDKLKSTIDIQKAFEELVEVETKANTVETQRTQTINKLVNEEKRLVDLETRRSTVQKASNAAVNESINTTEKLNQTVSNLSSGLEDMAKEYLASDAAMAENAKLAQQAEQIAQRLVHSYSDEARELAAVREAMRQRTVELRREVREGMTAADSIKSLGVQLTQLQADYENLSTAERNSAGGKALQQQIAELSTRYKGLRAEMGQFQSQVGDYEGAIKRAIGANDGLKGSIISLFINTEKLGKIQEQTAKAMAGASTGFQRAGIAAKSFGQQLWALASNPVIAILAALVAVFKIFQSAIASSRKNTDSFNRVLAPLKALLSGIKDVVQTVVGWVLKFVEATEAMLRAISKLAETLPFIGKYFKDINDRMDEGIKLERDKQALDEANRRALVEDAKAADRVSELKTEIAKKDKYTAEERLAMNQEAIRVEEERMRAELARAEMAFSIAARESALAQNSLKEDDALAEAEAKLYEVRTKSREANLRLERQAAQLREEIQKEELERLKNISAVTVQILQGEADGYKRAADNEKESLDDRLKANVEYVKRRAAILREQARVAMQESDDPNKTKLIQIKLQQDLQAIKLDSEKFIAEQTIAIRRRVEAATVKAIEVRYAAEQTRLQRITDDEKASLATRVTAFREYTESRIQAAREAAEREKAALVGDGEAVAAERLAIETKLNAYVASLRQEQIDKTLALEQAATQKIIDEINKRAAAMRESLSLDQSTELAELSAQYAQGIIDKEQYEKEKERITIEYATRSAQIEIDLLKESLNTFSGTNEEREKLTKALADAELKLEKDKQDAIISMNEATGEKLAAEYEKRKKALESALKDTVSTAADAFGKVYSQQSEKRQQQYDAELERVQGEYDARQAALDATEMSEERRAAKQAQIDAERQAKENELEAKKREETLRQARFEKNWATAQAAINTALAIGKAAASAPWPINLPLIAFAAATGAAQLAVIRNAPLPKYARGGKNLPEGFAFVGDAFKREVYESPTGAVGVTPAVPTVAYVERGANIYKDIPTYLKSQFSEMQGGAADLNRPLLSSNEIVGEIKALRRDIRRKDSPYLRVDVDAPHLWRISKGKDQRIRSISKSLHV